MSETPDTTEITPRPDVSPAAFKAWLQKQTRTEELGSTGLVRFGGTIDEEWHRLLKGILGVRAYREMRDNDASVGASLYAISSLVRSVGWEARRPNDSTSAEEAAVFLEECVTDMSHTWEDFLVEVLSMLPFGWSYFEKVFKVRAGRRPRGSRASSRFDDGRLGWRKIAIRAQETLDEWEIEEDGGIQGMWQIAAPRYNRTFIPISKSVLFRTERAKNNPEGRSILRNAWRSWFFLKRLEELEAIGIERDLVGIPKIELPAAYMDPNASAAKKAAKRDFMIQGQQVRRNEHEVIVFPSELNEEGKPTGFKFSLVTTGGSRQIDIGGAIERKKKEILQTMLTQFLALGMDKVGTQALGSEFTNLFVVSLGAILDIIEETIDRFMVRELMELNGFPEEDWPRYVHGDLDKKDAEKAANILKTLLDSGAITPDDELEDHVREENNLPPKPEPTEEELELEAARDAALVEAMNGGGDDDNDPAAGDNAEDTDQADEDEPIPPPTSNGSNGRQVPAR